MFLTRPWIDSLAILISFKCFMFILLVKWARTVLIIERGIPPASRLKSQTKYSHSMADGRKAMVLKKVFSVSGNYTLYT